MDNSCGDSSGFTPVFPFNLPDVVGKGRTENPGVNIVEKAESTRQKAESLKLKFYFFSLTFTKTLVSQARAALEKINESLVKLSMV